jgi:hypothetical protein
MICPRCGSNSMRPSRMRVSDLVRLLLLQRPVRCHVCLHRRFVNVVVAFMGREKRNNNAAGASPVK